VDREIDNTEQAHVDGKKKALRADEGICEIFGHD
jgi:hypothetical protein